jgi:glycosylphosphatidylinositol deacylase
MGGIVARLALTFEIDKLVDVVLTLSSPHLLPPLTFEHDMEAIYRRITYQHNASSPLLLSLCGGVSDTQIVSDMCALTQELVSVDDGFAVFTTGVPGVWTGVDHQAMMWCHQVRWRLARVLLEFTRVDSRQEQLAIAERWLLGRSEGRISPAPAEVIEVPVTSTNMTALLLPKPSSFVPRDPAAHIQWCPSKDTCRDLVMEITTFPWVSDDEAPFPLPGEGIRSNELAFAVNLQLPSSTGTLQIHVSQGDGIIVGPRVFGSARSNTWGKHRRVQMITYGMQFLTQCLPFLSVLHCIFRASPRTPSVSTD